MMMEIIAEFWFEIAAGLVATWLVIYTAVLSSRLKSYKKLNKLLKGGAVEEHILKLEERAVDQENTIDRLGQELKLLQSQLSRHPHHWHLLRYNAFGNTGSDLSFSLAVVNESGDGYVVSSIFGRDESRVYAKPLEGGKSKYALSEEESKAIKQALNK